MLNLCFAVAGYAKSQGKTPVTFGPTDLVCCRTLQGHTGKVGFSNLLIFFFFFLFQLFFNIFLFDDCWSGELNHDYSFQGYNFYFA